MTRAQAIEQFCSEYIKQHGLACPANTVTFIIENKIVETHNAFYLRDSNLRIEK